jgi:hypothetical protein
LTLDGDGKVRYHKVRYKMELRWVVANDTLQDMWNEKDYSHEGLGKIMKELNGDHLTKITQPPEDL